MTDLMETDDMVTTILKEKGGKKLSGMSVLCPERPLDQVNDLGNLLGFEANELSENPDEDFIKSRTRDNLQLLVNELWGLETERVEDAIVVSLPAPSTRIPREKPLPKEKPLTKWESFAKSKGIVNKKKKESRLIWDDAVREWVPRFGYKKAQAEVKKTWVMEMKGNAPDNEDPFEKATEEKRERVAKNEIHRLRNLARAKNVKVPSVKEAVLPKTSARKSSAKELSHAADLARRSTASLGVFQEKLASKVEKNVKKVPTGRKRKFDALVNDKEKDRSLSILDKMSNKRATLNVSKAVGKQIYNEESERSSEKKSGKGGKKVGGAKRRGGSGPKRRGGGGPMAKGRKGGKDVKKR
uniref:Ribosome biogenesis regulatory protein n=1 Tax=Caligus rogercresseyi TaxID=217165 RepID=C1BN95_CALRO|nr:Ribosome biogenesis regulatory protein homolog [Caligus rogercresseyi]|eukprot:TRINITY_DN5424_c0_g1_i1.p1 TRINITY_DN5424_c0_g1~~TRINITY_DN5424_c0_g1_i1.p1  ORF type:complete len:355 (-),score=117.75 TRINITY_DN5424_c0_g1_i1:160-1224(-)